MKLASLSIADLPHPRREKDAGKEKKENSKKAASRVDQGKKGKKGSVEQGAVVDGPAEQGSFLVSASSHLNSCPTLRRSQAAVGTGNAANLTCLSWQRNHNGLLKKAGYAEAASYPTLARPKFGDGHMETVKRTVDAPIVLAGEAGVPGTFQAEPNAPAPLSRGAPESLEGQVDFAGNKVYLEKLGDAVELWAVSAGRQETLRRKRST